MKNNIHTSYANPICILRIPILLLVCLLFSFTLLAQFTPARGTFVVTPPYPNKLSDYGNPNLLKMSATITATDPSFTSKAIRLKLSIFYNQQLLMQGNDMVVGERPMYLTMGQMLVLTQADLAPYFQQQNMRVSPVQYSQSLREGFYQFQLDILDYYTLQKIGLPLVASIYIMRYDPPLLYKPENKSVLMDKGQGLVQFQWNPRQIAPNTEYEFTIVELQQEKFVDPMIEFTARREGSYYYKTTTRMNTLNYGMMGELPLRWGKSYAWQVRAMTREGIDQVGTYEQDGYTDIRWFTYQKYCPTPTNIEVDVKNSTEATYTWDAAPEHTSYILKITAADNPEHRWLSVYPQEAKFEETQYRPDITYFYKLQGVCGEGVTSEESGERSFTMLPKGQIKNYKCNEGDGTESTGFETIANQKLLERDLQVGDTFTYSNWCKIKVTAVEKVGGYYKGKGVTRFPLAMFGFPLINIVFDSITVNTELVALSGGFEAVNRGIDGVADVDEAINVGRDLVSNVQGIVQDVKQLVEDVKEALNGLLTTLQEGKQPTTEKLENAKKVVDDLVVKGNTTLDELKKSPEENKEQIAKTEDAIRALTNTSECLKKNVETNQVEQNQKKNESTAKAGPNNYDTYNMYNMVAGCNLKESGENGIKGAQDLEDVTIKFELGKVWEFFNKCYDDYKNQKEGFVPRCVWDHNNYVPNGIFVPYYSDPALVAGIVDGLLETGEGVFNIVKFVDCYSLVSLRAWLSKECEYTREQTLTVLKSLVSIFSSAEQFKQVAGEICKSVGKYCDQTAGVDNQARYNQGKAIFNVASAVIGVGEIKAILNGEKTLLEVVNASATAYVKSMVAGGKAVGKIFKAGDKIADIAIKQIKQGANGKYAIIGRSMGNEKMIGVRDVYNELKNVQKIDVEIFDASSLTGSWKTKFDDAYKEFTILSNNGRLTSEEILQTKMYKLNKEWAQYLVDEKYTILDIGNIHNLTNSEFYEIEKSIIFK